MSRAGTMARGSIFRILSFFLNVFVLLIVMPIVVRELGDRMFGLWTIFAALTGYYFLLDFGLTQAVTRFISYYIGAKKKHDINKVLSSAVFTFILIGVVVFLLSIVAALSCGLIVGEDLVHTVRILLVLTGVDFLISQPMRAYRGAIEAFMDFDRLSFMEIAKTIIRSVLMVAVLNLGYGILALAFVNIAMNVFFYGGIMVFLQRKYAYLKVSIRDFDLGMTKEMFAFSKYLFLNQILYLVRYRMDSFIVAGFLGLSAVTIYAIANKLITYFQELMSRFFNMSGPLLGRYAGAEDSKNLEEKYHLASRVLSLVSYFIAGSLVLYGKAFITVWMGPEYVESYPILVILAVGVGLAQAQMLNHVLLQSINRHQVLTWSEVVEAVVSLGMALAFAKPFGLQGIAIALTAPVVVNKLLVQPLLFSRYSSISISKIAIIQAPTLIFSLIFFSMVFGAVSWLHMEPDSYFKLVVLIGSTGILYGIASIVLLNGEERNVFRSLFGKAYVRYVK